MGNCGEVTIMQKTFQEMAEKEKKVVIKDARDKLKKFETKVQFIRLFSTGSNAGGMLFEYASSQGEGPFKCTDRGTVIIYPTWDGKTFKRYGAPIPEELR